MIDAGRGQAAPILDRQQADYFDCFGYLKFPGLFAVDIAEITAIFDEVLAERGGAAPGRSGNRRVMVPFFVDQHEHLRALLDDPRIVAITTGLLGPDCEYLQSDGSNYFKETSWHTDTNNATSSERRIKIQFYLDPLVGDDGALRVIPGSQFTGGEYGRRLRQTLRGCLQDDRRSVESLGVAGPRVPCHVLETVPGDVLAWNYHLFHASFGGTQRRRAFGINFGAPPAGRKSRGT
jgi:ectoine hydroxylase-related dioxygenase (phytanoyl-CoA dioxygenase family)